jgi:hypothetical protein
MKSLAFALLPVAQAAIAQYALWVDLSGEWPGSADDNFIYARPGFADRYFERDALPWTHSTYFDGAAFRLGRAQFSRALALSWHVRAPGLRRFGDAMGGEREMVDGITMATVRRNS